MRITDAEPVCDRLAMNHLQNTFAISQNNLKTSTKGLKAFYSKSAMDHKYKIGDQVLYFNFNNPFNPEKFLPKNWSGPL